MTVLEGKDLQRCEGEHVRNPQRHLGSATTFEPLSFLLAEAPSGVQLAGATVVLAGVILATSKRRPATTQPGPVDAPTLGPSRD